MDGFRVTAHVPLFACPCFSADDFIELFGRSEPRLLGASAPTHRGLFILTCNTRDVRDFCDRRRTWRRLRQQGRYLRGITRWQGLASPTEQQAPGGNSSKTTSDLSEWQIIGISGCRSFWQPPHTLIFMSSLKIVETLFILKESIAMRCSVIELTYGCISTTLPLKQQTDIGVPYNIFVNALKIIANSRYLLGRQYIWLIIYFTAPWEFASPFTNKCVYLVVRTSKPFSRCNDLNHCVSR